MRCTTPGLAGLVSVLALLFTSCQKEISSDDTKGTNTTCQLTKITYYDENTGAVDDTAGIYYANDKISNIYLSTYSLNLIYTNNRVTRIDYFDAANVRYDFFDSVRYNSSGKIESLIVYSTATGTNEPNSGYEITYNTDGTPSKVLEKTDVGNGMEDAYEYLYSYSQQNIASMLITELATSDILPMGYTSDGNNNIFSKLPAEFIFADNMMFGISGVRFGFFSPFMFNKNNITTMQGVPVTYEKDSKDNITAMLVGGKKLAGYTYTCQ
jgi:hypothetical protein